MCHENTMEYTVEVFKVPVANDTEYKGWRMSSTDKKSTVQIAFCEKGVKVIKKLKQS